ncbi:MAG TPA: MFS transporter [Acidimicrobiales bacterium]|nr:MFS transporter [Acidimicrobiales bacterium]
MKARLGDAWRAANERRGLERHHVVLLVLLGAASFFDGYDTAIKTLALTQIREDFELTKSAASLMFAVVYFGALPAMALTRWADRIGRRRMLIWSVLGYMSFSGLTALAPNAQSYAALQMCQQVFLVAETAIVWTMAAEELPAKARGFGFGILGMNMALGTGFAAILYGGFLESVEHGWRYLYLVGVPPLLLVSFLRRGLPESRRFEVARDEGRLAGRWQKILEVPYRRWLLLVVGTTFLLQLSQQAQTFAIDYLQTDRGISTAASNGMLILAGLPGIPIMVAAGSLSDRYGRRLVGCGFALASMVGGFGFFWLPGGIPVLLPCMSLTLVGSMGSFPVLQTYVTELFPTGLRSSAASWAGTSGVLGRMMSLGLAAVLLHVTSQSASSQSWTATVLGVGPFLALIIIALAFPDTHGRELEETSGEGDGTPAPDPPPLPAPAVIAASTVS